MLIKGAGGTGIEENTFNSDGKFGVIENKFPNEEMPINGKIVKYEIVDGKIKGINGLNNFDFVITQDGELIIGSKHHFLGQGQNVLAAGELKINGQGQIKLINNLSGHYRPTAVEASQYAELFQDLGFELNNTWVEASKTIVDSDGLVEDVIRVSTEMIRGGK